MKREKNRNDVTIDNGNLFKEKEAQISFLISQLQSVKEQKDQLEKQLEKVSASDQHLIRKLSVMNVINNTEDLLQQLQRLQGDVLRIKTDKISDTSANDIKKYTKEIDRLRSLLAAKEEQLQKAYEELEQSKQSVAGLKLVVQQFTETPKALPVEEQKPTDAPQTLVAQLEQALREIRDIEIKVISYIHTVC